ncbi:hypothetical protein [Streptomyces sp. AS02]|uniref:hypothetical protein n=1 Tax=Streptomyces sp. AS02 TaxID=2938946 RepID=UPI00202121CA|nr:hypothetical protein [Streptomyces sp. AS02]MCL8009986.1 hypothetical protein [Streptomyces sp. AS02]
MSQHRTSDDHTSRDRAARPEATRVERALLIGFVTGLTRAVVGWLLDLARS